MLRINQNSSSAGAMSYYTQADCYTEGQDLVGVWRGQGAERLGLRGNVDKADWDALCDNRHPGSNLPLTPRKKSERRIGYDFNFHVPKSVSLLYSLTRDEQLLDAFRESVRDTMTEMESEMLTRVRKSGKNEDRTTGNMVWGEFVHFTSRPIDGVPDPHLHAHCFVFNTTFDKQEDKWKVGQFSSLKRDAPYFEARFHVRLARRLGELGLDVTRTKKGWELTGLDRKTLDKFSRRTALIEEEARRKGILDPEEKSELGAKTREKKQKELTLDELRVEWLSRLTDDERDQLDGVKRHVGADPIPEQADLAPTVVQQAISHGFERKSVLPERTLLADALKRGIGKLSISVSQPTEMTPSGRMMRRTLANMASFYTEQQSVDVREGLARRVEEGWFVGKAPYGYRNVRKDGRSIVEIDPSTSENVKRIFHLYAWEPLTLDELVVKLEVEGRMFRSPSTPFPRSSVHNILKDRAYIGEIEFRGQWYPGKHDPLIDRATWDRVRGIMDRCVYHAHAMTYAGELITCSHCGHPITGERKTKQSSTGERSYVYYRCARYNKPGHPRDRIPEAEFDRQMLDLFGRMKVVDPKVAEWLRAVLRSQSKDQQAETLAQHQELTRQQSLLMKQQGRLVDMRINDELDQETFAAKQTELRDRLASIKLQLESVGRSRDELAELALKVFELSQTLTEKWLTADYATKRRILEIVCLNFSLDGITLVPTMRKPFDMLAEGLLVSSSRGERI